jgi:hypothetical protein
MSDAVMIRLDVGKSELGVDKNLARPAKRAAEPPRARRRPQGVAGGKIA